MKQHQTSNAERRTPNIEWLAFRCCFKIQSSMFDVQRSMLFASLLPERRPEHGAA